MALTARQAARHFAACIERAARLLSTAPAKSSGAAFYPAIPDNDARTASFGQPLATEVSEGTLGTVLLVK